MTGDLSSRRYNVEASQLLDDLKKLVKKDTPLREAIHGALEKLESHPERGKPLKYQLPPLQGKIYSCDVQGRSGYRLIYVWEGGQVVWALILKPRDEGYPTENQIKLQAEKVMVKKAEAILLPIKTRP